MNQLVQSPSSVHGESEFLSFRIADQQFGIPVSLIQDIFMPESLTEVPLADKVIAGVLNLRGTIVTMIDGHAVFDLPKQKNTSAEMAIRLEFEGDSYGLIVDSVGDVLSLSTDLYENNPAHLESSWHPFAKGVYRLDDSLMVVLDIIAVLNLKLAHETA